MFREDCGVLKGICIDNDFQGSPPIQERRESIDNESMVLGTEAGIRDIVQYWVPHTILYLAIHAL